MSVNQRILTGLVNNEISFVTTVPCKQLAAVARACGCEQVVECEAADAPAAA